MIKRIAKYLLISILTGLLVMALLTNVNVPQLFVWVLILIASIVVCLLLSKLLNEFEFDKVLLVSVFLFVLLAPLLGKKEDTTLEKRNLSKFPSFRISYIWGTFYGFADYFNDRFAFRNASISLLAKMKLKVFNESPAPNLVEIDKGNWMFYTPLSYVNDISKPFSKDELDSIKINLEIMSKWFEEKKIKYYFTIPPAKEHVYPKLMSQGLQCETQFSRLDQLYNYIKDDTLIRMIDYRKELIEGKNTRVTYMEADSHWNRFGAYLAYYKIMSRISKDFPQLKPENITEYKIDSSLGYGGDLQCHLGFDDMYTSHYYFFTLKSGDKPVIADSTNIVDPKLPCVVRELPDKGKGLKLFVVHDSFTGALIDFLSPRFDRSVFTWVKTPPVPAILKEKPDILIHEVTERFLSSVLNLPAEIRDDKGFLSEYFPSYYQNSSRK